MSGIGRQQRGIAIRINSPFLNGAGWSAEVIKMIIAFGAPIDAADAKAIVDYLATNYGP